MDLTRIAADLWDAESDRTAIAPITTPSLELADAYEIQRVNIGRRVASGQRRVGHKVGLTSEAMQKQLGVDQPDFGVITDAMVIPSGGELALGELIAPRIEAEFAFVIGHALSSRPDYDELKASVSGIAVALEIIDSRIANWKIGLLDTVADNASSARIAVGPAREATPELFDAIVGGILTLQVDGDVASSGPGSAVLGDPLRGVAWLSDALADFGEGFDVGDVILAGAVHASVPLTGGRTWSATAAGFEPVSIRTVATDGSAE
jgi:2-keto-4-pentenoate hydratase